MRPSWSAALVLLWIAIPAASAQAATLQLSQPAPVALDAGASAPFAVGWKYSFSTVGSQAAGVVQSSTTIHWRTACVGAALVLRGPATTTVRFPPGSISNSVTGMEVFRVVSGAGNASVDSVSPPPATAQTNASAAPDGDGAAPRCTVTGQADAVGPVAATNEASTAALVTVRSLPAPPVAPSATVQPAPSAAWLAVVAVACAALVVRRRL